MDVQLDVVQRAMASEAVPEITLTAGQTVGVARTAAVFTWLPTNGPTLEGEPMHASAMGRRIPAHLAAAFRPVSVLPPDASIVAWLMLQAMGFTSNQVCLACVPPSFLVHALCV